MKVAFRGRVASDCPEFSTFSMAFRDSFTLRSALVNAEWISSQMPAGQEGCFVSGARGAYRQRQSCFELPSSARNENLVLSLSSQKKRNCKCERYTSLTLLLTTPRHSNPYPASVFNVIVVSLCAGLPTPSPSNTTINTFSNTGPSSLVRYFNLSTTKTSYLPVPNVFGCKKLLSVTNPITSPPPGTTTSRNGSVLTPNPPSTTHPSNSNTFPSTTHPHRHIPPHHHPHPRRRPLPQQQPHISTHLPRPARPRPRRKRRPPPRRSPDPTRVHPPQTRRVRLEREAPHARARREQRAFPHVEDAE